MTKLLSSLLILGVIFVNYSFSRTVTQSNSGAVTNRVRITSNTGGNTSDGGSITTGDIFTRLRLLNRFNFNYR